MNYELLYTFCVATVVLALAPGPDNIFVLVQSLAHGKKRGFATVFGLMTGCLVHTSLLAFGVSLLIRDTPAAYLGIKIFGACYLLYLAYKVFRAPAHLGLEADHVPTKSPRALYVQGFFMNVLNPKVALFFLAFFPGFLFSDSLSTPLQFFVLGGLFILMTLLVFGGLVLLAGSISKYIGMHQQRTSIILKWMQVVVFIGLAVFILFSGN